MVSSLGEKESQPNTPAREVSEVLRGFAARIGLAVVRGVDTGKSLRSISDYLGNGEVKAVATYEGIPTVASVLDSTTNLLTAGQLGCSVGTRLLGAR